jgi:hypothetical protein
VTVAERSGGGESELEAPRDGRPWLAGTLSALSILEVVQLVFTSLKSGVLRLSFAGPGGLAAGERPHRRSLFFREGQLVFASSSEPGDRLGPVLWRGGLIGWEALERCSAEVVPGRPLGQVLVDGGAITAADLYAGVAAQVREILFNAFLDTEGEFLFVEGEHGAPNEVRLPERTRELLLEGLKRVDETEQLLVEMGGRGALLTRRGALPAGTGEFAARLLEALEGSRSFAEAADESRLGLLFALREAAPLFRAGVLVGATEQAPAPARRQGSTSRLDTPAPLGAESPIVNAVLAAQPKRETTPGLGTGDTGTRSGGPFSLYRRIFRRVHGALAAARPGAERRLDSYFERLAEGRRYLFEGVSFGADGDLEVSRVLANVTATGAYKGAAAKARSLEALEELLTFALFEVKNVLPRAEAEALLREVGKMQVGKA